MANIVDRLLEEIDKKQNPSCIGLDPRIGDIPQYIKENAVSRLGNNEEAVADAFLMFNQRIIDATHDIVAVYKPNIAFYEQYGPVGLASFQKTIEYIKQKGCIAIEDGKRNDIGPTAQAYADGHLGVVELCRKDETNPEGTKPTLNVDMITVNPYLGIDGVKPFVDVSKKHGKGAFVLVKTSNKSSGDIQDKFVELDPWQTELISRRLSGSSVSLHDLPQYKDRKEYEESRLKVLAPNFVGVATLVDNWGADYVGERDFSGIGAVIGVTYPEEARVLRKLMPHTLALGPGFGVQQASIDGIVALFNENGEGGVINNSRGTNFAYKEEPYKSKYKETEHDKATRESAENMRNVIVSALREAKKCRW
jgi:orotidine-5'-phosphate decarboxylase